MKQNNKNFLLGGMAITVAAIGLLEFGIVRIDKYAIVAQSETKNVVLEKNGERAIIVDGSHVLVTYKFDPETYLAGTLVGINNDNIIIKDYRSGESKSADVRDIESVFFGEKKRQKHYTLKGAGNGFKCSLLYGGAWFLLGASESMEYGIAFGALATGCGSAVMIPSGSLLGYFNGRKKDKQAIEYVIGENGWTITQE